MRRRSRVPAGFFLLVAGMALSVAAYGAELFWFADGGQNLGGSGNWSMLTNPDQWSLRWSAKRNPTPPSFEDPDHMILISPGDMTPWNPSQTAVFTGFPGDVTIDTFFIFPPDSDPYTVGVDAGAGLRFETGPYSLVGGSLNLTGASPADNSIEVADSFWAGIWVPITGSTGMTKTGPGTLSLGVASSYSGGTTLAAGTLQLDGDYLLPDSGQVVFAGGTLAANDRPVCVGALSLKADSTLALGSLGSSVRPDVVFASAAAWGNGTLTVAGWGGPDGTSYGRFIITADPTASGVLDHIQFSDHAVGASWIAATGEVVLRDAPPAVTGLSPASGPTEGGTTVIITGTDFTGATDVKFGSTGATAFAVNTAGQIIADSPAGSGTVDVTVTTPSGTSATSSADQFTYAAAPTVTGLSPTSGPAAGGTTVTISGTNLTGATAVTFGVIGAAPFTVNSATQVTVTSPAGSGTVDVTVTTPSGTSATSSADQFAYFAAPTVTGISPTSGPIAGSTPVTITGTNFTGATGVTIGGASATAVSVTNSTTIAATTPAGTAGARDVVVTTPDGSGTGTGLFTYVAAPSVTGISPTSGPTAGGTSVTITGTNFTGATSVTIGGAAATGLSVVNATTITATTPAHAAATVDVAVTTPGGTGTGTNLYTYASGPTVTGVSPTSGPAAGGTSVTITGSGFTEATGVKFGSTSATSHTVNSAIQITATSPAGSGTVDVTVTTPGGTSATSSADQFAYVAAPTVTGISPTGGPTAGSTPVTITGTNFTGATGVTIGGASATAVSVTNSTTIAATTPAGTAGARDVVVTTPGGTGTGTGLYTYRSVTTFSGPTATGTGTATASISGGGAACAFVEGAAFVGASSVGVAAPVQFPHGLFRFTLRGCTGPVTMTITYPSALPAGSAYWKYGPMSKGATPAWYPFVAAPPAATATYTLTLEDDRLGDDDWDTTTDIVDQGGPGIPLDPGAAVPALDGAGLALLACLLAVTGLLVMRRMGC